MKAGLVRLFRDLGRVCLHVEFEFEVANPAGMFLPVYPMRKGHRFHAVLFRCSIDEQVPIQLLDRKGRQFPVSKGKPGYQDEEQTSRDKDGGY